MLCDKIEHWLWKSCYQQINIVYMRLSVFVGIYMNKKDLHVIASTLY